MSFFDPADDFNMLEDHLDRTRVELANVRALLRDMACLYEDSVCSTHSNYRDALSSARYRRAKAYLDQLEKKGGES